ncbi:MAG: methyl-accepting chemotaxis protein [Pseudomonadota bacterium]
MNILNVRIGRRLGAGFGLVLLLMCGLVGIGLFSLNSIGALNKKIIEQDLVRMDAAITVDASTRSNSRLALMPYLDTDPERLAVRTKKIDANKLAIDQSLDVLEKMAQQADATTIAKIRAERTQFMLAFRKASKVMSDGDRDGALKVIITEALPALDAVEQSIKEFVATQKTVVQQGGEHTQKQIGFATGLMSGLGLAALVFGILFALWITRSITRPLMAAVTVAQTVAGGDLTSRIDVRTSDETGQLLQALKTMNDNLVQIVGDIRASTDTIATASSQIASGNLELSSRTEQQASSLEQTASSMEQLTSSSKHSGDNARQANQLACNASDVALRGGAVVMKVVDTMGSISESSRKIVDIIAVIDGIAFQTNILALNAAVEAARAGEQGRGFAVVASEVRNLAQRSASAAREIKALIVDSVEKVEAGSKLVAQAGSTMDEIVASIRQVTDINAEIAAASLEQMAGIEQINLAVTEIDSFTQQNASLVEEAAAAAEAMKNQASDQARIVSVFTLAGAGRAQQLALR